MDQRQITDLVSTTVTDCLKRFVTLGLSSDRIDVKFYSDPDTPHCLYKPPNGMAVNLYQCQRLPESVVKDAVIDVMTSCAMHRQYQKDVDHMNRALIKAVTHRPLQVPYGSPKWVHMRLLLTRDQP